MNRRSMITLAVAVVIGLGAMMLTRQMLSVRQRQDGRGHAGGSGRRSRLQGRRNAQARHGQGDPRWPSRPFRPTRSRRSRTWKIAGSRRRMLEGDVLVEKKLGPKGTPPGLVANIPKGMRAFAIDVTEQSGVSGFILPGPPRGRGPVRAPATRTSFEARRSCKTCSCWRPARCSPGRRNARSSRGR